MNKCTWHNNNFQDAVESFLTSLPWFGAVNEFARYVNNVARGPYYPKI
jgi:hypothetical protein